MQLEAKQYSVWVTCLPARYLVHANIAAAAMVAAAAPGAPAVARRGVAKRPLQPCGPAPVDFVPPEIAKCSVPD